MSTEMNIGTMKNAAIVNADEKIKSDAQKKAQEKLARDARVADIIRKDHAIVYAAAMERLSRATYAELLRKDVCEIVSIGNVVTHQTQKDVYIISIVQTHKYLGGKKNWRVRPMPKFSFAFNAVTSKWYHIGIADEEQADVIEAYGKPLAIEYFKRMNAINAGMSMEELTSARAYNVLELPEFSEFTTGKKNATTQELKEGAAKVAAKVMPKVE